MRDLYSERKNKIINIYIERDFYNERKYKIIIYIYREREISTVNENTRFLIYRGRFHSERKYKILNI